MAMRSVVSFSGLRRLTKGANVALRSSVTGLRHFSDGKILGEEERAQENIYIQKMERERLEKAKQKAEREKAEKEKADKQKAGEGANKS
ncbi:uncharacterized protein At2g27730, mitochondrial isoform X1 [Solanum lycopersicum]|uniref:uncharacterized protein At2g27730, mitochondrial isoform X1 n=1 Tax=Solanum lycopersicum TaxID=4081 RepID=UPI000532BE5C|nr:uncharacterized protein At2g27730, mitochondrial isoform X1 [Solanum lycopersicum]